MIKKIRNEWSALCELLTKVNPVIMTCFVLSIVCMNLLANKSIDLSWVPGNDGNYPWLALDCGLFVSWLAFFSMDNIVRRFGPKASTKMTLVAVFINLVVCGVFLFAGTVSGEWGASYEFEGQINQALDSTISGTWYILLGSTIAFITSAIVHGVTSYTVGKLFKDKESLKAYAICSSAATSLGQFVDNFLFAFIVSRVFFGWNILQCIMCSVSGMIVEFLLSFVFVPLGHKIYKGDMERCSND